MWVKQNLKYSHGFHNTKRTVTDEKWEASGIPLHAENCKAGFKLKDNRILKTEECRFDRKVRKALEIQLQDTAPRSEHGIILQYSI